MSFVQRIPDEILRIRCDPRSAFPISIVTRLSRYGALSENFLRRFLGEGVNSKLVLSKNLPSVDVQHFLEMPSHVRHAGFRYP